MDFLFFTQRIICHEKHWLLYANFPKHINSIPAWRRLNNKCINLIIQLIINQVLLFLCIFNLIGVANNQMYICNSSCLL